jgi:large subunit ribosomal protein L29
MKMQNVREMPEVELLKALKDLQEEKLKLKIQGRTGELKKTARPAQIRKDIARIKTALNEKAKAEANA